MPSGKLHLKRTPAEQAERDFLKAQKATRKAAKRRRKAHPESSSDDCSRSPSGSKRRRTHSASRSSAPDSGPADHSYVFYDSEDEYGPQPAPAASTSPHRSYKQDFEEIYARLEEERFREKMFGAMEEDERLDGLESHLNGYAHIPRRWRGGGMDRMDDEFGIDPHLMEDEDYAEWMRAGMWKKKHAAEHAEQERKAAERAARKAREKAVRDETARLEKTAEEDRKRRRRSRERRRVAETREWYDVRWKELLAAGEELLSFTDIPWPVTLQDADSRRSRGISLDDLTVENIAAFLLPSEGDRAGDADAAKTRKEKLRETMLRFHPDKFEGRILRRVRESDRETVKEAVGIVARVVNGLMGESK